MRIIGLVLAASLLAGSAGAQTQLREGSPFSLRGRIALDAAHSPLVSVSNNALVDVDLTVAPGAGFLPEGIGFELGLYHFDSSIPFLGGTAGFAALTFELAGGRLAVGAPRSAASGLQYAPLPGGMTAGLHGIHALLGGMPMSVTLQTLLGEPYWGFRYDNRLGSLDWSVSATRSGGALASTNLAFGVSGDFASVHLYGAGEAYRDGANWATTLRLGGQLPLRDWGWVRSGVLGVEYSRSAVGFMADYSMTGYATLDLTDRMAMTVSAMAINSTAGGASQMYGLNVDYDVWLGVRIGVGALRTTDSPFTTYTANLSRRF